MPSTLLERPAEVEESPQSSLRTKLLTDQTARSGTDKTREPGRDQSLSRRQRMEIQLHEIFEGHEEFLGWTPD